MVGYENVVGFSRDVILDFSEESDNMDLTQTPSPLGDFSFDAEKWVSMENLFFLRIFYRNWESYTLDFKMKYLNLNR